MADNEAHSRKLRLAALRKVMSEHTYGQRLAYIVSKVSGKAIKQSLPHIAVLAYAGSQRELEAIQITLSTPAVCQYLTVRCRR